MSLIVTRGLVSVMWRRLSLAFERRTSREDCALLPREPIPLRDPSAEVLRLRAELARGWFLLGRFHRA